MQTNREYGNAGEDIAERYLKKHGWRILSRNYLIKGGEIDLIGYRFGVLAFFEVKTRSNELYGRPVDAVDGEKLRNLHRAINAFSSAYIKGGRVPVFYPGGVTLRRYIFKKRIDTIEIRMTRDNKLESLNHIKNMEKIK